MGTRRPKVMTPWSGLYRPDDQFKRDCQPEKCPLCGLAVLVDFAHELLLHEMPACAEFEAQAAASPSFSAAVELFKFKPKRSN
jgi:hypothetical protein